MSSEGPDRRHPALLSTIPALDAACPSKFKDLNLGCYKQCYACYAARESKYGDGMMYWTDTRIKGKLSGPCLAHGEEEPAVHACTVHESLYNN